MVVMNLLALNIALVLFAAQAVLAYDYVVIGGGTAGLTVASRLAEDPAVSVAVIEAGFNAEHLQEVFIPGLFGSGIAFSTLDWAYETVPQTNLNNRTVIINAGKALGGSTVINAMLFPRAGKQQYDAWGTLNNDSSWKWDSLLPYFKKSESFTPPNAFQSANGARFDPDFNGFEGRVKVGFPNYFYPQAALWQAATESLGFLPSPDLSNGAPHAVGVTPECSAVCAYYTPFADQPNFSVITNATVTRIIWAERTNGSALVASAVEYLVNNQTINASATREVILAAGTIGSPKVLELSGVGNSTILEAAGVQPVLELPTVGENLADHVHSWANAFTNITSTWDPLFTDAAYLEQQLALWYENRTGPFTTFSGSLSIVTPSDVLPKTQLYALLTQAREKLTYFATQFSNGNAELARGIEAQHGILLKMYEEDEALPLELNLAPGYGGPSSVRPQRNYTSINSVLYQPLSRGRTHISSSNPLSPPVVDPGYWSHPLDVAAQVGGIRLARKMLTAPPLDSIYQGEFEPGSNRTTDAEIEEWLRGVITSDNHETGSLAMLPKGLGGVVDTSLRVYGTANVRAVDASIIPFPISAHLSSTIYMIGEKAAAIIKGEHD